MPKTPEQVVADELLREAVIRATAAYKVVPDGVMVQDFVVQGRGTSWDEHGDRHTYTFTVFSDGELDPVTIMGHLSFGLATWGGEFSRGGEDSAS